MVPKFTIKLFPLSPIHVGNWQKNLHKNIDFIVHHNMNHVIHEDKLFRQLVLRKKMDEFLIAAQTTKFDIKTFLVDKLSLNDNDLQQFLEEVKAYSCQSPTDIKGDYLPFIRDGYGKPFIPGTSIKGAIRTATLYCALKEMLATNERLKSDLLTELSNNLNKPRRNPKELGNFLEKYFQNFVLDEWTSGDPHTDLFRAVEVQDVYLDDDIINVEEVTVSGMKKDKQQDTLNIYAECINSKKEISINLGINLWLFKQIGNSPKRGFPGSLFLGKYILQNAENPEQLLTRLLEFCHTYAADSIPKEGAPISKEPYIFRLGWGTGIFSKTILSLIYNEVTGYDRDKLMRAVGAGSSEFPMTRKIVIQDGEKGELGWARLEKVNAAESGSRA